MRIVSDKCMNTYASGLHPCLHAWCLDLAITKWILLFCKVVSGMVREIRYDRSVGRREEPQPSAVADVNGTVHIRSGPASQE